MTRALARAARAAVMTGVLALGSMAAPAAHAAVRVLIVEGLGGEAQYARQFDAQVRALSADSQRLDGADAVTVLAGQQATRERVLATLRGLRSQLDAGDELILYLIGHGSFDGRQYKFNLPGPDLSDADLRGALDGMPELRQLVIAPGSASGALLPILAAPRRVVLTGTRSGAEKNVTRFGSALVAALQSDEADTDKDGRVSVREAYAFATRAVQQAYRRDGLLASEHAVLQGQDAREFTLAALPDAGTDAGTGTDAGASAAAAGGRAAAAAPAQGGIARVPAAWLQRRVALNERISALEGRKGALPAQEYQQQLQELLLQLARLQQQIDQAAAAPARTAPPPLPDGVRHGPP